MPLRIVYPQTTGEFVDSAITLGARGDSLYEYLLKQWWVWGDRRHQRCAVMCSRRPCAATARTYLRLAVPARRAWIRRMFDRSVDGILEVLLQRSDPSGMLYVAEQPRRSHGACVHGSVGMPFPQHARARRSRPYMSVRRVTATLRYAHERAITCVSGPLPRRLKVAAQNGPPGVLSTWIAGAGGLNV